MVSVCKSLASCASLIPFCVCANLLEVKVPPRLHRPPVSPCSNLWLNFFSDQRSLPHIALPPSRPIAIFSPSPWPAHHKSHEL
jgi:hypothetical protein